MKFIQFNEKGADKRHYFVGKSYASILADTSDGTEFGGIEFESHQTLSKEEVEKLNLGYFAAGVEAVEGGCLSYKLQSLRKELEEGDSASFCSSQDGGYKIMVKDGKILFTEKESEGVWDKWTALTHKNNGRFPAALSHLEWDKKNELRIREEWTRRTTLGSARLQIISAFITKLGKLPESL